MPAASRAFRCQRGETASSYLYGRGQMRQPICFTGINQYKHQEGRAQLWSFSRGVGLAAQRDFKKLHGKQCLFFLNRRDYCAGGSRRLRSSCLRSSRRLSSPPAVAPAAAAKDSICLWTADNSSSARRRRNTTRQLSASAQVGGAADSNAISNSSRRSRSSR